MRVYINHNSLAYLDVRFKSHCFDIRQGEFYSRKACLLHADYIRIFEKAYVNGLLSFRGKKVVITILNKQGLQVSLLCYVGDTINVITIKHHWKAWTHQRIDFIRERNRINLFNFDFNLTTHEQSKIETRRSDLFKFTNRSYYGKKRTKTNMEKNW